MIWIRNKGDKVIQKKYIFVLLLGAVAVFIGVSQAIYYFNEIVAPPVPVQAFGMSRLEAGGHKIFLFGESVTIEIPAGLSLFMENYF
jgi:hypothetical protein